MTKITILHSTANWLTQTQTWLYSQIKNIDSEVFESHIICEETLNLDQFQVNNIHARKAMPLRQRLQSKLSEIFILFRRSGHILVTGKQVNPQLIHSHFGNRGWEDIPAVKKLGCQHIVTFYGYDINQLPLQQPIWKKNYQELFTSANLFLCEGSFMAESLVKQGCPREKVRVHHLGVQTKDITYIPRTWKIGQPLKILIAAGFREKKGITYGLEALAKLKHHTPIDVTIIGDASAKPDSILEKKAILDTIHKLELTENIRLLGFQPHQIMHEEAYKHHLFLSPSVTAMDGDSEGGAPVSIIEMIASGMIVVSTNHCDIPEVINYPIKDWLVDERDADQLYERLKWLTNNTKKWIDLQKSGRRHIENEYDSVTQGEKLTTIYASPLSLSQ